MVPNRSKVGNDPKLGMFEAVLIECQTNEGYSTFALKQEIVLSFEQYDHFDSKDKFVSQMGTGIF